MNKLPKKVKILGVWYRVVITKRPPKLYGDESLGNVTMRDSTIRVWDAPDKNQMWKTLWHEIYHAFIYESRLFASYDEEMACRHFASMMMGLEYKY